MIVPAMPQRAPTSFPIFAAVSGVTLPDAPRPCSASSFSISSRSTTRAAGLAASSEISIPAMPFWRASKFSLSCPYEPLLSNGSTAMPGRVSWPRPCALSSRPSEPSSASDASAGTKRERIESVPRSEGQCHPFRRRHDLGGQALRPRLAAGGRDQGVDGFVAVLGLMVEQHQALHARLARQRHRLFERRVAPAPVLLQLLGRVHRIVDEQLHSPQERYEVLAPRRGGLIVPARPELVVGHVRHARAARCGREPVAEGGAGVAQSHRLHAEGPHRELARHNLLHRELRRQRVQRDREHGRVHLLPEDRLERGRPLARAPDPHRVAGGEKRFEVREPLDMVPVRVRQQDLRLYRAVLTLHQLASQSPDAGSGVEDNQLAPTLTPAGAFHSDARRVAAVARGVGSGGGDGAPRPPKSHRVGHPSRQRRTLWAKLWRIREVGQAAVSPDPRDPPHDRPADASSAERSRIRISRRLISMYPLSTSSRMVRLTVSRDDPIICAMVWCVSRRVMRSEPASSARSRSSCATRPFTSSRTRLPTFSSTRRNRRESSRNSPMAMPGDCWRMAWKSSRRITSRLESSIAITWAERGSSSINDISPKKSPSPSTERITSRPSSPISTTFTCPLATTYSASPGSSSNRMTVLRG